MSPVKLILLLGICVTGFVTIECVDCSNEAGYCSFYTSSLKCYITNSDTQSIKALLRDCSSNSSSLVHLKVYKNYVSNEYWNLLIDIELPTNIQFLQFYNSYDKDQIRLTTFSQNTGLTRIQTSSYIELESNNFFTHFTALHTIYMHYVLSREPLSFTNLLSLTFLRVFLVGPVTQALDEGIVSGLTNLVFLDLQDSYFNGITEGAFLNLNKLTYLDLSDNQLTYFEDGALRNLSSLARLYLYDNNIQIVPDDAFESLTDLTVLDLSNNPGFPLNALIQAKSVRYLYLENNGYSTLEPYALQQMDSLEYLFLSDPFVCDCKLQWTSLVGQYGLTIRSSGCLEPLDLFSRYITNVSLYTNCSQTESFQCFYRSVTCLGNQVCHNTENSYFCGCPRGYALHGSGQCEDVDECKETTDCQHPCRNTEGSFHCTCDEGYELSSDGYSCDDIDECQELNGGCEFGCRNTVGSYQCYCYYSHKLTNNTHCDNDIQYIVIRGIGTEDYQFDCYGDYNFTITNFTCENIPQTSVTTTMLTTTTATTPIGCPIGYVQRYSGECVDEDECDFYTSCQHSCVNTDGSFHCDCYEGYELADDQYNCTDVNECHQMNGGCEFGCRNTIGSYQCYCYYGLELTNDTHCGDKIHYILVQGIENEDYQFACYGDYNLTITNFTCENISPTSAATFMLTTAMTTNLTTQDTTAIQSICPIGFVQRYSGECVDEDECDFYSKCQHSCVNTDGSFHCGCNDGYKLADDGYSCDDDQSAATSEQFLTSTIIIIITLLIFIIALQMVVIILILLCNIRMRKAAGKSNIHRNMHRTQFHETPLVELIDKRPDIAPDMTIENPDNPTYQVMK